jgi:2-polyprenyl-3-methyl-5-hydroxy-6-metoxy-1,4-benzoquinol methylase
MDVKLETQSLLTHSADNYEIDLSLYQQALEAKNNLTLPLADEIELLHQLAEFELGLFLLKNKGLNGYWTSYIILHGMHKENLSPLESWVMNSCPSVIATRERFHIFQQELQQHLRSNMSVASIPCGTMDDTLTLNYDNITNVSLTGIDLDPVSLELAKISAISHGITSANFMHKDAWHLEQESQYDIITSNGLNIYQPDDSKVVELYRQFHKSLKTDGILITSFLTPPPMLSTDSTWSNFNISDVLKQKAIFTDIIGVSWQAFRTEAQTTEQLNKAGFDVIKVIYDSQGMFPTAIAKKR